jgi:cytochrome c oxidase cbb3-type subunit 3
MPKVLDHSIDGIEEYDTPLPRWWLYLFYATIVWSFGYWVAYPSWFGPGLTGWHQNEAWSQEVAEHEKAHPKASGNAVLAKFMGDPQAVTEGKALFAQNCAACHGPEGKGLIGPNLTDDTWLYGGAPEAIMKTVSEGTAKGMPTWGPILGADKIAKTTAFVHSLAKH